MWIGGKRCLIYIAADGSGHTLIQSDLEIRSIWGTSHSDLWFLSTGRAITNWTGQYAAGDSLPGDDDEEWNCVTGSDPDAPVYVVGPMGLVMQWTGQRWMEFDTETPRSSHLSVLRRAGPLRHHGHGPGSLLRRRGLAHGGVLGLRGAELVLLR